MRKNLLSLIKYSFLTSAMVFLTSVSVFAASKSTTVNISENGQNLTFTIDFEKAGEYQATLEGPDKSYEFTTVDNDTMSVDVDKAKAGEWTATVNSDKEIGKYTLSVTGKKATATTNVDSSISVGKDIVGLNIYFKDNTLCVSWADTSIGTIVVKVVNLDNSEVIAEENIADSKYECEIPESVRNISVSVVPSTSKNVEGAAQTFTYELPTKPSVDINYDAPEITNKTSVNANVIIDNKYGFYVENNDVKTYSSEINEPGTYDITVSLDNEGENNIKFYLVDENGNMYSYDKLFIRDTQAPQVNLDKEYDQIKTYDASLNISGKAEDYTAFTINGEEVSTTTDNTFEYTVSLHTGTNAIDIVAIDDAGNETAYNLNIVRMEKQQLTLLDKIKIGAFVLVIIIAVACFIITRRRKKNSKIANENVTINIESLNKVAEEKSEKTDRVENENNEKLSFIENIISFYELNKNFVLRILIFFVVWFWFFIIAVSLGVSSSASMEPTIMVHDLTIESKLAYLVRSPQRGDIISFNRDGKHYGKRVVGIAGDKIEFHDGYVYINGEIYDESAYLSEDVETNCNRTFEVPKNCVFVMGDNREGSIDSRFWENPYVNKKEIKSKCFLIVPLHLIFG